MFTIGRAALIERLHQELVAPGAAVQLLGPPGIGKTHLARSVRSGWPGQVFWVDLEDRRTEAELHEAVARAGDVAPDPYDRPFVHVLTSATMPLVVVDAAEGSPLVEAIDRWTAQNPPRLLFTSRQRLALPAVEIEVGPLASEDAATLFAHRVHRSGAPEVPEALGRTLVERLDGHPLSIELAAGRLRLLAAEELLEELNVDLLADRQRGPRHGSLRDALERSWEVLSPAARRALARLSCFTTPFGRHGFCAVTGEGLDVLDELASASVLTTDIDDRGARHHRLLTPVRALAAERLMDREGARAAHHDWLLTAAERSVARLNRTDAADAMARLRRLRPALLELTAHPDAVLAARAAVALGALTRMQGPLHAFVEVADVLPTGGLPAELHARLACLRAEHHIRLGRHADAAASVADADKGHPWVALTLAELAFAAGRMEETAGALDALALAPEPVARRATILRGATLTRQGQHDRAIALLRETADRCVDDPENRGLALRYLAMAVRFGGTGPVAEDALIEAAALHEAAGQHRLEGLCRSILALVMADSDPEGALRETVAARRRCRAIGEHAFVHGVDQHEVLILLSLGRVDAARERLAGVDRQGANPTHQVTYRFLDGVLAMSEGRHDEGRSVLASAIAEAGVLGDGWHTETFVPFLAVANRDLAHVVDAPGPMAELVSQCLRGEVPDTHETVVGRLLLRLLASGGGLVVYPDGSFVRADGRAVDLGRKGVLKRVVLALHAAPAPMSIEELVAVVWGTELDPSVGRNRAHVALSQLRGAGLGVHLATHMTEAGPRYELLVRP